MDWATLDEKQEYNGEIVLKSKELTRELVKKIIARYSCPIMAEECRFIGNFSQIDFEQWSFYRCSFSQASLCNSTFKNCFSQETIWKLSDFRSAKILYGEHIDDVLTGCDYFDLSVFGTKFHRCDFTASSFKLSRLENCDLTCSKFNAVDFNDASLRNCDIRGTELDIRERDNAATISESKKPSNKFNTVFATLAIFSLLSLFLSLAISFQGELNTQQTSLFETCSTSWKMGFGCIVGCLGRRFIDTKKSSKSVD